MAAPNSSKSNQDNSVPVVDTEFCFNSSTTFDVRKQPPVNSKVGSIVIQVDKVEKFKLEKLEKGLALNDTKGKRILTVKPKDTKLGKIRNFFGISLDKKQLLWNVFRTMEPQLSFTVDTSGANWKIEVPGKDYKFEGSFVGPIFTIFYISRDNSRIAAAKVKLDNQVKLNNQLEGTEIYSVYNVEVNTGYDQAFIFGLVAVLEQLRLQ